MKPWRRKVKPDERALKSARSERKHSDKLKREAQSLTRELDRIREENGFAAAVLEYLEGP